MYILIVEDEEKIRLALERWLVGLGHKVCWSSTGAGAIKHLVIERDENGNSTIDMVLLDIMLGDGKVSGFDVCRFIAADEKLSDIPVIIASGLPPDAIREETNRTSHMILKKCILMQKPVDLNDLLHYLHIYERMT